jgi:hypothetical protein
MDATAKLIAIILLTSFATERILAAIDYLIDFIGALRDPAKADDQRKGWRKLGLLALGALITYAVVRLTGIRILRVLQPDKTSEPLDFWLTWLVVYAGADRVRDFLSGAGGDKGGAKPKLTEEKAPVLRIQIDRDGAVRELSRP